jgi:hypothetical protein
LQELRRRQTAKILGLNLTWIYIFSYLWYPYLNEMNLKSIRCVC